MQIEMSLPTRPKSIRELESNYEFEFKAIVDGKIRIQKWGMPQIKGDVRWSVHRSTIQRWEATIVIQSTEERGI